MFEDRVDAGQRLGRVLTHLRDGGLVVLGLPRGGVPVAYEAARVLDAPMDVIVVRKLGLPRHPEVAMGALGEGGVVYIDWAVVLAGGVSAAQLEHVIEVQSAELDSRVRILRGQRPPPELQGRAVVIVDDGIATGATVQAAVRVARGLGAARVVVAAPVAPRHVVELLERVADQVVVLETPEAFRAVGEFYIDFTPTDDLQVKAILRALSAGGGVVSPAPVDVGEPGPARVVLT